MNENVCNVNYSVGKLKFLIFPKIALNAWINNILLVAQLLNNAMPNPCSATVSATLLKLLLIRNLLKC